MRLSKHTHHIKTTTTTKHRKLYNLTIFWITEKKNKNYIIFCSFSYTTGIGIDKIYTHLCLAVM